MSTLPSIEQARAILLAAVTPLDIEDVPVAGALDRILAADIVAHYDVPAFANSAMDGYALRTAPAGARLLVVGESRAGTPFAGAVGEGEAVQISTGAALPAGATAVLQLERVCVEDDYIVLEDDVAEGRNVRAAGTDLPRGATVLHAGTRLGPAEIGVAIGAGRATVRCARRPRVAVVSTGDELVAPGAPLEAGQVHDSNRAMLAALARRCGAEIIGSLHAADAPHQTRTAIAQAMEGADVVILAGGVSVGPHDHVKAALDTLGVKQLLWRVALRPGKPTWMGERDGTLVLGLPGNPVSAYVTFVLFARPALAALQGGDARVPRRRARLGVAVPRSADRDECVRVTIGADGVTVVPTGPQGSHVLSSMVGAQALAVVPRGDGELPAGAELDLEPV